MEPTLKVAKEFPNVKFEHITGYKRSKNVATGNIRFYEGRYIQGVVAGLMTKTNKIGYIGAYPIAEVIMGINAFAQGLKSVNKDASISVIWANTWYDPVKEADAAKVHIAEGADVLAQHTDSPAMLQIAEKNGAMGFGQSTDMSAFAPGNSKCGRTNTKIVGWRGRADQAAKVKGMFLRPEQIKEFISRNKEILKVRAEISLLNNQDDLTIKIEVNPDNSFDYTSNLRDIINLRANIIKVKPNSLPKDGVVIDDKR